MITSFFTCPRKVPYIGETLSSYFSRFTDVPLVFESGDVPSYLNRTRVQRVKSNDGLSCVLHWMFVVDWLYHNTNEQWYMICEDDIEFRQKIAVPGFLPKIEDVGFISAYCAKPNRPKIKGWNYPRIGPGGFCGSLCIILSRASLTKVALDTTKFFELSRGGLHLDTAIGDFFKDQRNYVHYPTLILHRGEVSTYERNNLPQHIDSSARQPAL